ncbi:hypothetical protein OG900_05280 [Streptomyces sp. NBC_00433]
MFGFDGPLCPLYEDRPSDGLARTFHRVLADAGLEPAELSGLADPYGMLRRLPHSFPRPARQTPRGRRPAYTAAAVARRRTPRRGPPAAARPPGSHPA